MRRSLIILIFFFFFLRAQAQTLDFAWSTYDTSSKIDVKSFSALTDVESEFAKNFEDFANNRARLTLTDSGNRISPRELQRPDFPLPCMCKLVNDTIYVTTALGFMSGLGIITAIHQDRAATTFFQEADNTDVFKLKNIDSVYIDRISVSADNQILTLLQKPIFVGNETIFGIFEGQFKPFYELESDSKPAIQRNYKARLFFKCRLQTSDN